MFVIKNRKSQVTGTVTVTATVHEGSYTANDNGEGDTDHEYRVVEVNGVPIELVVDDDNGELVGDPNWCEIVMTAITGKARLLSGIELRD